MDDRADDGIREARHDRRAAVAGERRQMVSGENDGFGEIVGDLDLRELKARARVDSDDLDILMGDGDTAVTLTTSWTNDLEAAADAAERAGNELHHLAVVLRERAERRRRPPSGAVLPEEMGVTPSQ
ncbi:hypothetical protein ABT297_03970 [Dactylosporangium sp. NPDC000555]|uniref:hypothetical protein n=1 Tax=Dactylosporangium sp. NPDC000555 TaxID=3154260 RepID=UPI003327A508